MGEALITRRFRLPDEGALLLSVKTVAPESVATTVLSPDAKLTVWFISGLVEPVDSTIKLREPLLTLTYPDAAP